MKTSINKIATKWQKAIVIGSFWAASEIILGSFLHNLRIPLSGSIMAFISILILISFTQFWKEKGLIWRAGLITALMKSISPSAIILGPMLGITLEALILELFILVFGRNIIGYVIGGAFAMSSVLFQKIGRLLLMYGMDLVEIFKNFVGFATKILNIPSFSSKEIAITFVAIYLLMGILAGLLGYLIAKAALKSNESLEINKLFPKKEKIFNKTDKAKYSGILLLLNIALLVLGMYFLNTLPLYFSISFATAYISFVIIRYKNSLNRLKNFKFWIWFVLITMASSYFLSSPEEGNTIFKLQGLKQGLILNIRAAMVVIGFAAISTELKNPLIKSVMYKRGAAPLYISLEIAFGVLPQIIKAVPPAKEFFKKPFNFIIKFLNSSDYILNLIVMNENNPDKKAATLIILTGEIQQGKTTLLSRIVDELKLQNIKVRGFLSKVIIEDGKRKGYNLESVEDNQSINLCTTNKDDSRINYGKFYFNKEAFKKGAEIISNSNNSNTDLLIIDEVGPLEIGGGGWANAISEKTEQTNFPVLMVVRKNLAEKASRKWDFDIVKTFKLSDNKDTYSDLITEIKKSV